MSADERPIVREPVLWAAPIVVITVITPFVLGYDTQEALAVHIAYTMAIAPLALLATGLAPAAGVTALAGVWLALAPFVAGYSDEGVEAWAIDLVSGLAIAALGALSARPLRRRTVSQLAMFSGGKDAR